MVPHPVRRCAAAAPPRRATSRRAGSSTLLLRLGPEGDLFGLRRGGLNVGKLRRQPHGVVVGEHIPTGVLREKVRHGDGRVRLDPRADPRGGRAAQRGWPETDAEFPLRLIGLRELRSHNSWMHNSPLLTRGGRAHAARIHPDDADALGIEDGGAVRIASKSGTRRGRSSRR